MSIAVQLLGPPMLRRAGAEVYLASQKALGLLFFLAVQPGQSYSRSRLVAQLWEESGEREGRNSLSVALSRLRQSLPGVPIVAEGDTLSWAPDAETSVDAAQFQALTGAAADLEQLAEAVALWHGPFLDGFAVRDSASYEEWLRVERETWQVRLLEVLGRLIAGHEAAGRWAPALGYARRALAVDPLQEQGHRTLMRLLARSGDRAAALGQYRTCQELLAGELGAEPDPATVELYEAIARGEWSQRPSPAAPPVRHPPPRLPPVHLAQSTLPLVGREAELAQLQHELAQVVETGRGRLIVVQGEAGIGKSRLIEELLGTIDQAGRPPWNVLLGHSYEAERSLPYRPFIDALRAILPALDLTTLGLPEIWLAEVGRLLPDIAAGQPGQPSLANQLDPTQQRHRLFEGVARLLAALGTPLLLLLEDAHWADEGTLQLLSFILRHETTHSLLVIATVRSEDLQSELAGLLRSLEREGRLATLRLERLGADSTTDLLREMVHEGIEYLGERLYAETEGNPLFAVEMVRSLIEQGALQVKTAANLSSLELPNSVQAVIQGRLTRLDEFDRTLLNAAAIFRRGALFEHIAAVGGLDEAVALDALERLLAAQLLRETVDRGGGGHELYIFGHDKIRQVVYDGLSAARRRVLHRRAVEVLAADHAPVEELAYHATLGHLWAQGLDWSETAASEARQVLGYAAATRLYQQALDCLAHLPGDLAQQRREIRLRLQQAQVGFYVQPGALTEWLAPAEQAASALGDEELVTRVRLAQASALYIQGRFTQALPLLESLTTVPVIAASDELRAHFLNTLGRLLVLRGELERAEVTLRQALPLLEGQVPPLDLIVSTNMLASAIAYRGRFDEALTLAQTALQQAEALGDSTALGIGYAFLEVIAQTRGDWAVAERYGRQAISFSHDSANSIYEYVGHVFLGLALARQGNLAGGLHVARQALAMAERAQINVLLGRAHGWLAEVLLLAGELDEARAVVSAGRRICQQHGYTLEGAICARIQAEIYLAAGQWEPAEQALRASLVVLEAIDAVPELARAERALAQLATASGDDDRAAAARQRAQGHFAAMGMTNELALLAPLPNARGRA